MRTDYRYMAMALEEAELAMAQDEIPVGAVLVDSTGRVLSKGHNERESLHDATAHAEIKVIREAGKIIGDWHLTGCTLYVTLEPCPMCAGALIMAKISRVVYGLPDAKTGAVESIFNIPGHPALHQNIEVTAGIMEDECHEILMRFFKKRR